MVSPAPDNAELRQQLSRFAALSREFDAEGRAMLEEERQRVIRWLREEDDGDRDPKTMLPWSFIAKFRVVEEPELGPVPQPVNAARKQAMGRATAEQMADALAMGGQRAEGLAEVSSDMMLYALTRFPKLVIQSAKDNADVTQHAQMLRSIWTSPEVQQLLREETSREWPQEYH
ncbi:hypothetical protein LAH08_05707 [Micromonospora noduli]|uniref:Uncharacterized protein n=2 Tax=Micromonospora noduli TaxID=709876 RepID=A0A328MVQ3_9ACTN|nr:hypothetical protein LAH08_05707 [Micromonospora noduli]